MITHVTAHSVAQAQSLSALLESQIERVSMAPHRLRERKIQENKNDVLVKRERREIERKT
eukprot:1560412-Amphidinium_carterae.1